jgi:hypothetical protein
MRVKVSFTAAVRDGLVGRAPELSATMDVNDPADAAEVLEEVEQHVRNNLIEVEVLDVEEAD